MVSVDGQHGPLPATGCIVARAASIPRPRRRGTISGLRAARPTQLGVDAFDAAGNRSAVASMSASTQPSRPAAGGVDEQPEDR